MESVLKKYFGYSSFRANQKNAIEQILHGRDVLIVMATGSGKSLCYQVPPLVTGKTAIVISPLISLMQDQVMSLSQKGIKAQHLSSAQNNKFVKSAAENGDFALLYMTPEKAFNLDSGFWSKMMRKGVCLLAVDEAHCISEWGHEFRGEYKELHKLREFLPDVPYIALTATATERVRLDIINSLQLELACVIIGSFDRPNLYYSAKMLSRNISFREELAQEISGELRSGGSMLVYCTTVKDTEEHFRRFWQRVANLSPRSTYCANFKRFGALLILPSSGPYSGRSIRRPQISHRPGHSPDRHSDDCRSAVVQAIVQTETQTTKVWNSLKHAGINAGVYHGQMSSVDRDSIHRLFIQDELQIIVATVAFGMGIDKPDIRCVIHYGCPKSLESYYQESGRCGRDGLPSKCILYYSRGDFAKAEFFISEARTGERRKAIRDAFLAAQRFCGITTCRRKYILEHFGEKLSSENCGNCDNCKGSASSEMDLTKEAYFLLNCIQSCGGHFGLNLPIDVLRGSRSKKILENQFDKLPVHGLGKNFSANWWKALGSELLSLGYLKEKTFDMIRLISVSPQGLQFLHSASQSGHVKFCIVPTNEMIYENCKKNGSQSDTAVLVESLPTLESQGFSEKEIKLYNVLLQLRINFARTEATAPYAVCSDQTLQKLAVLRPTTKARLGNIEGINEYLMARYGDQILSAIKCFCENEGLECNKESRLQCVDSKIASVNTKTVTRNMDCKITDSKLEAWKMWQEKRLTLYEIANLPERPIPIKESTVAQYILDCARSGYELDWKRYCKVHDFTLNVAEEIQAGMEKAGSREKLKNIKEQVPESITYTQIKIYLTMEELGLTVEEILGTELLDSKENDFVEASTTEMKVDNEVMPNMLNKGRIESKLNACEEDTFTKPPWLSGGRHEQGKRQKVNAEDNILNKDKHVRENLKNCRMPDALELQATKDSLLSWLSEQKGATIPQICEYFNGSNRHSTLELISELEANFMIYLKNDVYRVL